MNAWTICTQTRTLQTRSFSCIIYENKKCDEAHLLVEEDPVEVGRRGEELFSHAEFTGGDLDAGVDRSRRAARGRNLHHVRQEEPKCGEKRRASMRAMSRHDDAASVTNLSFIQLGFGLRCGLNLGHAVGCRQDHPLSELCNHTFSLLNTNVNDRPRTDPMFGLMEAMLHLCFTHLFLKTRRSFPGLRGFSRLLLSSSGRSAAFRVRLYSTTRKSGQREQGGFQHHLIRQSQYTQAI